MTTTGLPALSYRTETFWSMLEGWPHYLETGHLPAPAWGETLQHHAPRYEATWAVGVEAFADMDTAHSALPPFEYAAVAVYWRDGLRSVKQAGKALHRDENVVRVAVWSGTETMLARLCGLASSDAHASARIFRERLNMRRM